MKIAVLSGKGGTGKTLVSVNLAAINKDAVYADCDVEEPNGHLFFQPNNVIKEEVTVKIPAIDINRCTGCKKCVDFCSFNALAFTKEVIVFEEICHSCGGCMLVCPTKAISEKDKTIGYIHTGYSKDVKVVTGMMNAGEASGVPIINAILNKIKDDINVFIDCPPGSACVVMDSIKDADFCVLVAEPTLFGCHNLKMVYELVKLFKKPCGVILNKCGNEYNPSEEFCKEQNITILGRINFDTELGKMNSEGKIVARESYFYREMFSALYNNIVKEVNSETIVNP